LRHFYSKLADLIEVNVLEPFDPWFKLFIAVDLLTEEVRQGLATLCAEELQPVSVLQSMTEVFEEWLRTPLYETEAGVLGDQICG
jgi:hypothetical protein